MTTVGAFAAKTHFSELLKEVENGGQVTITKHGHIVAKIIPAHGRGKETVQSAIHKILEFSKKHYLGDLDWKELRDEGRK